MSGPFHLVRRFFGSLKPGPPEARDNAWALRHMTEGETKLWKQMSNPDRRHAVAVANAVGLELGPEVPREVVSAALLHDVGKTISRLRTPARVFATIFWAINDESKAHKWRNKKTFRGRLAQYRLHPELGSALLADAGAHALTVAWAAQHHLPAERCDIPEQYADVLRRHDND